MRLKIQVALKQATGSLDSPSPSIVGLLISEGNLLAALGDPDLTAGERAAIEEAPGAIRAALQRLGEDPFEFDAALLRHGYP